MFEPFGFVVHRLRVVLQSLDQKQLEQAVTADDFKGDLAPLRRQAHAVVRRVRDQRLVLNSSTNVLVCTEQVV